jgi:hypothetical protein
MIVQTRAGGLLLIRQTDHAALAAVFARHWGNNHFEPLRPRPSLLIAAEHHDDGWLAWEAAPTVDPATRRPYQFTDLPAGEHLAFYRQGIADVLKRDPYAGLLVSMHLSGLHQRRFGTESRPTPRPAGPNEHAAALRRALDQLEDQQRELREQLPSAGVDPRFLKDGPLWANYKLLQVFDRLSLYFCTAPPRAATIGPAPRDHKGHEVDLELMPLDGGAVAVDPYPFDQPALPVEVRAALIPDRPYQTDAELRAELARAAPERLEFVLRPR